MLSLSHITKVYETGGESVTALRGIDLHFRRHEFVSILGPSGCGKTTLLNIIGGLDHYTEGDLVIDGTSTKEYTDRDWDTYRNHRIGFVFQSYQLIPHQTVLSNVELALTLSGVPKAERRRRAAEALERVGLGDQLKKKPSQMSGGQMQRVAIARALVNDPEILLADEPTGALDTRTSEQIMELLREVAADKLVIMVTHNPALADEYSTRIIRVLDGCVTDDTNPYSEKEAEAEVAAHKKAEAEKAQAEAAVAANEAKTPGKSGNPRKKGRKKRTSMSFWTAFALSCNNLLTKKTRTLLTSFAGSIGIIGIALILALSNGIQLYIDRVQQDALSSYPLTIESVTMDMNEMLSAITGGQDDGSTVPDGYICSSPAVVRMMTAFAGGIRKNDLKAFKKYLESGATDIASSEVATVEYEYGVTPQIYHIYKNPDTGEEQLVQANPSTLMNSLTASVMGTSSYSSSSMGMTARATDIFDCLLDNRDLLDAQYDLLTGHWPESYNEVVIVADSNSRINDLYLYALGIKDPQEMSGIIAKIYAGKADEISLESTPISYEELLSQTFTVVVAGDLWSPAGDGTYTYMGDPKKNAAHVRDLMNTADSEGSRTVTLRVSGIIRPKKDAAATSVTGVIGYTSALSDYLIEKGNETDIVRDQLAHPETDVTTGLPFDSITLENLSTAQKAARMREALERGGRTSDDLAGDLSSMIFARTFLSQYEKVEQMVRQAAGGDIDTRDARVLQATMLLQALSDPQIKDNPYMKTYFGDSLGSFQVDDGRISQMAAIMAEMKDASFREMSGGYSLYELTCTVIAVAGHRDRSTDPPTVNVVPLTEAAEADTDRFAALSGTEWENAYDEYLAVLPDEALALLWEQRYAQTSDSTYAENCELLGIADKENPTAINLYPVSFEMKDHIISEINAYNAGKAEKEQIVYTDYIGVLFSSISLILNIITYVLVAFVAISLVVSSIMIGIITYISVLERTREIGILRAIGASKRDVSRVFNAETIIIGLTAGVMAIVVTLLLIIPLNLILHALTGVNVGAVLPWLGAVILVLISMTLTLVAGLIPSGVAARKDPVEALRTD